MLIITKKGAYDWIDNRVILLDTIGADHGVLESSQFFLYSRESSRLMVAESISDQFTQWFNQLLLDIPQSEVVMSSYGVEGLFQSEVDINILSAVIVPTDADLTVIKLSSSDILDISFPDETLSD